MKRLPQLRPRVWWGIGFIYLAGLGWLGCLLVPFMHLSHKIGLGIGLLIMAETSFVIGITLLGRAYYKELKDRLLKLLASKSS